MIDKLMASIKSFSSNLDKSAVNHSTRYFAVITPGHSGSVWLTKILNLHPDVLCWHEGAHQKFYPGKYYDISDKDRRDWFLSILHANHYPKIFRALGDIGSIKNNFEYFYDLSMEFYCYGLIRNPVLYIRSQMMSFEVYRNTPFPEAFKKIFKKDIDYIRANHPKLNGKIDSFSYKIFLRSCLNLLNSVNTMEKKALEIFKIEDLKSINTVRNLYPKMCNLPPPSDSILTKYIGRQVNSHLIQNIHKNYISVYRSWDKRMKAVFNLLCKDIMGKYYQDETRVLFPQYSKSKNFVKPSLAVPDLHHVRSLPDLKNIIISQNPEIPMLLSNRKTFQAVKLLAKWCQEIMVHASETDLTVDRKSLLEYYQGFTGFQFGCICGGVSYFFMQVLNLFDIPAICFSYRLEKHGEKISHVTTLFYDQDFGEYYLFDLYLNLYYVDSLTKKRLPIGTLLNRIRNKEYSRIKTVGSQTKRKYITKDPRTPYRKSIPQELLLNDKPIRLENGKYLYKVLFCLETLADWLKKVDHIRGNKTRNEFLFDVMLENQGIDSFENKSINDLFLEKTSGLIKNSYT